MMKVTRWRWGALWLAVFVLNTVSAIPPRKDINPALLYLHAFNLFPQLEESESTVLGRENSGEVSDEERALAQRFDRSFALIVSAGAFKTPCDWGTDPADGPHALVPNLIKIRTAVNAACLRARVALAEGDQTRARDELLAVSVMSRHAAAGSSLVATMIQVAAELKILNFISTHFDRLKPQIRSELAAGLNAAPPRATVADAMFSEKAAFCDWLVDKLEAWRARNVEDSKVLDEFRRVLAEAFSSEKDLADRIIEASGGTSAGVVRYVKGLEPIYAKSFAIAKASGPDLKRSMAEFEAALNSTTNLLARVVMPNIGKARVKELEFQERMSRLPESAP